MELHLFKEAHKRISPWIQETPLLSSDAINRLMGYNIFFKCENFQVTNSFKIRGCLNALIDQPKVPRIARSSGNFAQALAWAGKQLAIKTTVIMPSTAPKTKLEKTKALGTDIIECTPSHHEAYKLLEEKSQELQATILSSFDDPLIIAGQGTVALEVYEKLPTFSHFLAPIGGGGLLSGCATVLKQLNSKIELIAIEPKGAADYALSRKKGERLIIPAADSIADGLRSPCVGKNNWPLLQKYVDECCTASDSAIIEAMKLLYTHLDTIIEPSGAISFATLLERPGWKPKGDVICVLSGGNVDDSQFQKWMEI